MLHKHTGVHIYSLWLSLYLTITPTQRVDDSCCYGRANINLSTRFGFIASVIYYNFDFFSGFPRHIQFYLIAGAMDTDMEINGHLGIQKHHLEHTGIG